MRAVWIERWLAVEGRHRLPDVVVASLVVAIAFQVGSVIRRGFAREPSRVTAPPAGLVATNGTNPLANLVEAHLFGLAPSPQAGVVPTTLPLRLIGTLALADPTKGLAIIGESAASMSIYAVGSQLPGAARLNEVYARKVVIERNGQLEVLELPPIDLLGQSAAKLAPVARPHGKPKLPVSAIKLPERRPDQPHLNPYVFARTPLLRQLQPAPILADGFLIGYRLPTLPEPKGGSGIGPQSVIVAINGVALSDGTIAAGALNALGRATTAVVTVLQPDGSTRNVSVSTELIIGRTGGQVPP